MNLFNHTLIRLIKSFGRPMILSLLSERSIFTISKAELKPNVETRTYSPMSRALAMIDCNSRERVHVLLPLLKPYWF
jgi:hypothetical protein